MASSGAPFTIAAAVMFAIGLLVWWIFVYPVNVELAKWVNGPVPGDWADWRALWEWGQAANGLAQLAGFAALIASVLVTKEKKVKKAKTKDVGRPSAVSAARCHGIVANPFQLPPPRQTMACIRGALAIALC